MLFVLEPHLYIPPRFILFYKILQPVLCYKIQKGLKSVIFQNIVCFIRIIADAQYSVRTGAFDNSLIELFHFAFIVRSVKAGLIIHSCLEEFFYIGRIFGVFTFYNSDLTCGSAGACICSAFFDYAVFKEINGRKHIRSCLTECV